MPTPQLSGIKTKTIESSSESTKTKYMDADKKVDIKSYLDRLNKEEKAGLKEIEVRETPKQLGKDDFLKLFHEASDHLGDFREQGLSESDQLIKYLTSLLTTKR